MLQHLHIRNYGLFSATDIDFVRGLNIITGETGAGKSLLAGALGLIMGKRADNSVIFHDDEKCVVEARFGDLPAESLSRLQLFEEFDQTDGIILLRREISTSGKSRAFINDTPVSLAVMREVSGLLFDLHNQHENLELLAPSRQGAFLDAYAGLQNRARDFGEKLNEVRKAEKNLNDLKAQESEARRQEDYYRFNVEELGAAQLKVGEESDLENELNLLQHVEELREALGQAVEGLYHADQSVFGMLGELIEPLKKAAQVNNRIEEEKDRLVDVQAQVKDSAFALQDLLDSADSDPERLNEIEDRLAVYHQLKLKHKVQNGDELVEVYQDFSNKLQAVENLDTQILEARQKLDMLLEELRQIGLELEEARKAHREDLQRDILAVLNEVGFNKVRFEVAVERQADEESLLEVDGEKVRLGPTGFNRIYFLIQTNPGLPIGPIADIASGGEISRIMLAIKTVLADQFEFPVLVFDEIDTGISGEVARKVGQVMRRLGERFQLLAITHLPQIAALGNAHYEIVKTVDDDRTSSAVCRLDEAARIEELAKMLSGDQPTDSARRNARELLRG